MSFLRLKCTKFDFGWGCASDTDGEALNAPPVSLAAFKGVYSKGMDGKEGKGKESWERKGKLRYKKEWKKGEKGEREEK